MDRSRILFEYVKAAAFLIFIGACYLLVFAGAIALLWVVFATLVRMAI